MADGEDSERCSYQCYYFAFNEQDRDCFFHPFEEHPDKVLKLKKKRELSSNEEVIHVAATDGDHIHSNTKHACTICGFNFDKAVVKRDKFEKVAEGKAAYVNNTLDTSLSPRRKREIVREAIAKLGQKGYNLLFKNCEHFAKYCRYGEERSDQVRQLGMFGAIGAVMGGALLLVFGGGKDKK